MITFTDTAKEKVLSFLKTNAARKGQVLRISISGRTASTFNYQFFLDDEKNKKEDDSVVEIGGFVTHIDAESAKNLKGARVDWADSSYGSGFKVENPNKPQNNLSDPRAQKIQALLDSEINPNLASHGGRVELIDIQGNKVLVTLSGGCQGCGMAKVTLRHGIETRIKEEVPGIEEVVDVTDHAGGQNPYYSHGG
ncbi:MAG: iron-sulfur cluster assembly accessory protein [Pseudomonadota bacterium]